MAKLCNLVLEISFVDIPLCPLSQLTILESTSLAKPYSFSQGSWLNVGVEIVGEVHCIHELLGIRPSHHGISNVLAVNDHTPQRFLDPCFGVVAGVLKSLEAVFWQLVLDGKLHPPWHVVEMLKGVAGQGAAEGVKANRNAGSSSAQRSPDSVDHLTSSSLRELLGHVRCRK